MRKQLFITVLSITAVACADAPDELATTEDDLRIRLTEVELTGLDPVGPDFVYEGWIILNGRPHSTGRFEASGSTTLHRFATTPYVRHRASNFVLTIEPAVNDDPAPAATHILAGDLRRGAGLLSLDHPAAIGTDFADAAGSFILETPSSADPNDFAQGIWWLDPAGPGPSLTLPTLPEGWVYEGWVVGENGPISTGRFTATTGADSDAGGEAAGRNGTPPFPGQDFIRPPLDIVGHAAVITVEPHPDTSPAPFTMKPLVDPRIEDVGPARLQAMENRSTETNPSGIVHSIGGAARVLSVYIDGLESLGDDFVYEGWLIVNGEPMSTGRFDVNGSRSVQRFFVSRNDARRASTFVLTIEPRIGDDPAPAATHVLAGNLGRRRNGYITIGHPAALATDFSDATGSFILATPSTAARPGDYAQGIWFLDPSGPAPSLDLPQLPEGWVYEGWVVGADGPVSTGRFRDASGADADGGGPTAGPDGTPPFPGQDFIDPANVLLGQAAVITVEPEPDNSPLPFVMKPLIDGEIEDVGPASLQSLANVAEESNPYGYVTINRIGY